MIFIVDCHESTNTDSRNDSVAIYLISCIKIRTNRHCEPTLVGVAIQKLKSKNAVAIDCRENPNEFSRNDEKIAQYDSTSVIASIWNLDSKCVAIHSFL